MLAVAPQRRQAGVEDPGLAIGGEEDIGLHRVVVPRADAVPARQAQRPELGRPGQIDREQRADRSRRAAQRQAVAVVEVARVDLVDAELDVPVRRQRQLDAPRPLADRPVDPVRDDVARQRATEAQVHEVARPGEEVGTHPEAAELQVERVVEERLLVREFRQARDAAAAVDLLHLHQRGQARLGAEVLAVAVGQGELELRLRPRPQLVEIERRPGDDLVGAAQQFLGAAMQVVGRLGEVTELKVDAALVETGARPVPVAEQALVRARRLRDRAKAQGGAEGERGELGRDGHRNRPVRQPQAVAAVKPSSPAASSSAASPAAPARR